MVVGAIQSQISATDLTVKPGYSSATLAVEVVNNSDRQASFQILLAATGNTNPEPHEWYQLSPLTSSKVPPGTHSCYTVKISDTPIPGFVGLANITVRIISPELQTEERHILRLRVEPGLGVVSFKVELPTQTFQDYPGHLVELPVRVYNNNRNPISVEMTCPGLQDWLLEDSLTTARLLPNRWHDLVITCQLPEEIALCHSQNYPFKVQVRDEQGDSAEAAGNLEVLPLGYCELIATQTALKIPPSFHGFPKRHATAVETQLRLENHSNLSTTAQLIAFPAPTSVEAAEQRHCQVTLELETLLLEPDQNGVVSTTIQVDRHWLGWVKLLLIDIQARLEDERLDLRNDTETLQVRVAPLIPRWLQALALLFVIGAISGIGLFRDYRQHHQQLVSTVQFNGTGTRALSGSSDQTIRQWQVQRRLHSTGKVIRLDKAVRVLRYRSVDNNQVIVGLENGEIQIWDLLTQPDQPLRTLVSPTGQQNDLGDRVMALTTTANARQLFSGYGSGLIAQWDIGPDTPVQDIGAQPPTHELFIPELAIYDLALVGEDQQALAIAGRYNKLLLWNWLETSEGPSSTDSDDEFVKASNKNLSPINYPSGGQDDYITSLATAEQKPLRLATADNQGQIMIWDLASCLGQTTPCTVIDQWQSESNAAIRDIALSNNGCYLVSASDEGQLTLWPLTDQGRRLTKYLNGQTVKKAKTRFNSVAIKLIESDILIASGAEDHRVRLHRLKRVTETCQGT